MRVDRISLTRRIELTDRGSTLADWGVSKLGAENRRDLLEIIEGRHGLRSTIVTSQLPVEKWHAVIGDPTLADAILDRLRPQRLPARPERRIHAKDPQTVWTKTITSPHNVTPASPRSDW